jgi:hypothetical protein
MITHSTDNSFGHCIVAPAYNNHRGWRLRVMPSTMVLSRDSCFGRKHDETEQRSSSSRLLCLDTGTSFQWRHHRFRWLSALHERCHVANSFHHPKKCAGHQAISTAAKAGIDIGLAISVFMSFSNTLLQHVSAPRVVKTPI